MKQFFSLSFEIPHLKRVNLRLGELIEAADLLSSTVFEIALFSRTPIPHPPEKGPSGPFLQ
jgi:hypothetical protein